MVFSLVLLHLNHCGVTLVHSLAKKEKRKTFPDGLSVLNYNTCDYSN